MRIRIVTRKAEIYRTSSLILERSQNRMLIVERSASLLLGPRNDSDEKRYHRCLRHRIFSAPAAKAASLMYLYNRHDTKAEMQLRGIPFSRVRAALAELGATLGGRPHFSINSFSEPGNPLVIGDEDFNLWVASPDGRFLAMAVSSKRYAGELYTSYARQFSKLPRKSIGRLASELAAREAAEGLLS